jgi:hypothetical protein
MSEVFGVRDMNGTARDVLSQAMEYCAGKLRLADSQAAIDRIKAGDGQARGYCHYSVAKQVAESLGALDENIKASYIYDHDATPEDHCFGEAARALPIHLLVWTERKTAALIAAVEAWNSALAHCYSETVGGCHASHLLDVQVVDNAAVENRISHGALLSSLHQRPIQVWKR